MLSRRRRTRLAALARAALPVALAACGSDDPGGPSPEVPAPGGHIAYVYWDAASDGYDLYVVDGDGSGRAALYASPVSDFGPDWTPAGDRVAFSSNGALWVVGAAGGDARPFGGLAGGHPVWAPEGRGLAYLAPYADSAGRPHGAGVWVVDAEGAEPRRVPTAQDQLCTRECSTVREVAWLPGGDRLAYEVFVKGTGTVQVEYAGTRPSDGAVAPLPGYEGAGDGSRSGFPRWSPDGRFVAYPGVTWVGVVPAGGGDTTRIDFHPGVVYAVAWAPDGEWLAAEVNTGAATSPELWVVRRDGAGKRRLAEHASRPAWGPGH